MRKLRCFDVCHELLQVAYKSLVESVLIFNIVVWYGNLGVKGNAKLAHIVGMAGKIIGAKQGSLSDLYLTAVEWKTAQILDDAKHPLFSQYRNSSQANDTKCQLPGRMFTQNLLSQMLFLF